MKSAYLEGAEASSLFAARLAGEIRRYVNAHDAHLKIALEGTLGAGKSHIARAMLREWGVAGPIPSPTYSLLEPYEDAQPGAAHMDWYRLADPLELDMLDWEGLCEKTAVVLVEWASRIPEYSQQMDLQLSLAVQGLGREVALTALSPIGSDLLKSFDP